MLYRLMIACFIGSKNTYDHTYLCWKELTNFSLLFELRSLCNPLKRLEPGTQVGCGWLSRATFGLSLFTLKITWFSHLFVECKCTVGAMICIGAKNPKGVFDFSVSFRKWPNCAMLWW